MNCPNPSKGKGKAGKGAKASYSGGKGPWQPVWPQQQHNGIKSICAVSEKTKVQVDLEGFAKPSKTVRPKAVVSSTSVNYDTKFFPVKIQKP